MTRFDPRCTPEEFRTYLIGKWVARFALLAAIAGAVIAAYFPF